METDARPNAIIYHRGCPDGFGAAWAAWRSHIDADYYPINHGDQLPELPRETAVYILDFSPPREQMELMHDRHGSGRVRVIDHHITGATNLDGLPNCTFDMNRSGAVMAWDEFHTDPNTPEMLLYVQDRDLWQSELPHTKAINAYLFAVGFDFQKWNAIHRAMGKTNARNNMIKAGEIYHESEMRLVRQIAGRAAWGMMAGHRVPMVNSPTLRSEIADRMLSRHRSAPFAAVWYDGNSQIRHWSLRSRGDFDVSKIAEAMGGGGHAAAAGFITKQPLPEDPFAQISKE